MAETIAGDRWTDRPHCDCEVYQRCKICDPKWFAQYKEQNPMSKEHRNEQEEASVLDTVMSALNERLKGLAFAKTEEYDEANGVYVITIKRIKDGPPCKVRVDLEL